MENSELLEIVVKRWNEAVLSNSIPAWHSLSSMASLQAEMMVRENPNNIMAYAFHGIGLAAFNQYIKLQKVNEDANIA